MLLHVGLAEVLVGIPDPGQIITMRKEHKAWKSQKKEMGDEIVRFSREETFGSCLPLTI